MNQAFLQKLNDIIDANITNTSFSAKDLAEKMGMSHSSLWRKVRSQTGKSITQYIKEVRLKKAFELLHAEDVTVAELTFRLGFSSPSYFSSCFKEFYGQPPVKFKKSNGNNRDNGDDHKRQKQNLSEKSRRKSALNKPGLKSTLFQSSVVYVIIIGVTVAVILMIPKLFKPSEKLDISIAVLPFEVLSDEKDKQHIADGMMLAIQQKLGEIRDLRVIPRTTVEEYCNTDKPQKKIGQKLKVEYVVEGSFQLKGDTMNLIISLNHVKMDRQIWADNYIREWTDVFNVQSEVARQIANELKVLVTPQVKEIIEAVPTTDLTAYENYLLGNDFYYRSLNDSDYLIASDFFKKATEIDSSFALAWIGLAKVHRGFYWYERNDVDHSLASKYLNKALRISPDNKEVRAEEAYFYDDCKKDYKKSLRLLEKLNKEYPNDSEIQGSIGLILIRKGEPEEALKNLIKGISLNPSYWGYWRFTGNLLSNFRLPESNQAEKYYKKAIELNPSNNSSYTRLFQYYLKTGQIGKAQRFISVNEERFDPRLLKVNYIQLELSDRNLHKALGIAQSLSEEVLETRSFIHTKHHYLGLIYRAMSEYDKAFICFDKERIFLEEQVRSYENDYRLYSSLAYAYAGIGKKEEALRANKKLQQIIHNYYENDNSGHFVKYEKSEILVMLGESNLALEELDKLMQNNSHNYIEYLKRNPAWDALRGYEVFKEIMANSEYQLNLSDD